MLSITDLLDFIDLDRETVQIVNDATQLPEAEATAMASELLRTHRGIYLLHEMFKDQIAEAAADHAISGNAVCAKTYAYFSRKYPIPHML
jgi:predicted HD phosphohydrolase